MNFRRTAPGILVVVILLAFNVAVFSETEGSDDELQAYERYLNQIISSCYAKIHMADTRSENLRDYCELAEKKANFIIRNKGKLIKDMHQINLAPRPYKVYHYVNSKFFEKLRNDEH
jgi:hypothetical protein